MTAGVEATTREGALGIDVGATHIKWVEWSSGDVRASGVVPTPRSGCDDVIDTIVAIGQSRPSSGQVGVAVPGHLRDGRARTDVIPNLPGGWRGLPVQAMLEAGLDRPVRLVNDARAFAMAELSLGAARTVTDCLFVTLGTGVGGAVAVNGAVLMNETDSFGEVGHQMVDPGGDACGCGARGCLETVAGGAAIVRILCTALEHGEPSDLRAPWQRDAASVTPEAIVRAAAFGDGLARSVLGNAGRLLGVAVGSALAILGCSTVVIGGGVAPALVVMGPLLEAELERRSAWIGPCQVLPSMLGHRAGAIGAALWASMT